ncbi:MAG: hypothetical protein KatS3mg044_0159 [Rhodothermaceae bacterium]|nr:MAG: hypothetical protein KatS3mg044_0159 [Rhodothermaceae bacterium]
METFVAGILDRLRSYFDPEALGHLLTDRLADLIVASLVFLAFYLLWRLLHRLLDPVLRKTGLDLTARSFMETVIKYAILILGLINAFAIMGINTASLIASLGIAGLTIGFAARDALSNMISGLFIFWDRPFVIGDLIEVGDKYGQVERITLRSTRVVTPDGKMLAIPNNEIVNKTVASYTNFPHLRIEVEVTVATHEDLGRARRLLLELVRNDPDYLDDPPPRVVVTALNDYNVALSLQAWVRDERRHVEKRFALREAVFETLTAAGVDMPYETLSLTPIEIRQADR